MSPFKLLLVLATALCVTIVGCKKETKPPASKPEKDKFQNALNDLRDMNTRQFEDGADPSSDNGTIDRAIEAAQEAEKNSTGQQVAEHMTLRHWLILMRDQNQQQNEHQKLIIEASSYDLIKSAADIDSMSKKIRRYQAFNQNVIIKISNGWMKLLGERASKEGMDQKLVDKALGNISKSFSMIKPELTTVRLMDDALCRAILEQHGILKNAYEKWSWNEEDGLPEFEDAEHTAAFKLADEKAQKAIKAQDDAQARILTIQQQMR